MAKIKQVRKLAREDTKRVMEALGAEPLREWEVWHDDKIADQVHKYWTGSVDEQKHRQNIAKLIGSEMRTAFDHILEVGCGTGLVYKALYEELGIPPMYQGVDNAEPMLKKAREAYPEVSFEKGDAFKLDFSRNQFDVACSFEVFGHMPPDCLKAAIAELIRVSYRVAIFSVWLSGGGVEKGSDHYAFPREFVLDMFGESAEGKSFLISEHDIGHSTAFVVRVA